MKANDWLDVEMDRLTDRLNRTLPDGRIEVQTLPGCTETRSAALGSFTPGAQPTAINR